MTAVQLKGTPHTLPDRAKVRIPNDATNDASLENFRY
jgi:hypothetical protein